MTQSSRALVSFTAAAVTLGVAAPALHGQALKRATLTVHWTRDTKVAEAARMGDGAVTRSTNETRETLEAVAVFEIPDVDYGGFAAFGYAAGQVTAPDHVQVRGGPRRALPPSRLVSFSGHTTLEAHGTRVAPNINDGEASGPPGPPCEITTSARGQGDFAAGRAGAGGGQEPLVTFQFTPRAATFTLASMATFPVTEASHASANCGGPTSETRTHDPIAVNFPMLSALMAQVAPPWTGDVKVTATGYRGEASTHETRGGQSTTETVSFTLDVGGAGAGGAAPLPAAGAVVSPGAPAAPAAPVSGVGSSPPAPPPGMAPTGAMGGMPMGPALLAHGQVTFTQAGREATWQLYKGNLVTMGGPFAAPLFYSPDGKPPAAGRGAGGPQLMLVVVDRGQGAGIEQLRVIGGPAGDSHYDPSSGQCAVRAQATASGVQGSVDCPGKAGGGVTKLVFTAAP